MSKWKAIKFLMNDRDVSWLDFNERVLELASMDTTPVLERLKFCDIFISNLDEFFMKRVGRLQHKLKDNPFAPALIERESEIKRKTSELLKRLEKTSIELKATLSSNRINIKSWSELNQKQKEFLNSLFRNEIFPILTPLSVAYGHSFPFMSNLSRSVILKLREDSESEPIFSRVKIPKKIPQWYRLNEEEYISLEEIVFNQIEEIFPDCIIEEKIIARVTRNAEMEELLDDDNEDIGQALEDSLRDKKFSNLVRLELSNSNAPWCTSKLIEELNVESKNIYPISSIASSTKFAQLVKMTAKPELLYPKWTPLTPNQFNPKTNDIFSTIRSRDFIVHHPYESFSESVEHFIEKASTDPKVLAIKITLYRTDIESRLVKSLLKAAQEGKEVAVLVELKARFEEEKNLQIAELLEKEGIHVIRGMSGLKTHAKTCIVVRKDSDKLRTYAHIGTGNYNPKTAKLYTDLSLFTCDERITSESIKLFNYLTGVTKGNEFKHLLIAPINLKKQMITKIRREVQNKKNGLPARIMAKMNSLEDQEIIIELYKASIEGVEISLIVRGFTCLIPELPGVSDNIKIYSILGEFLEHSRVFHFADGKESILDGEVFIGSADWMSRNLDQRVECIVPLYQTDVKKVAVKCFLSAFKDVGHLWKMNADKSYRLTKKASEAKFLTPQDYLKSKIKKKKFDLPELDKIFNNNTRARKKPEINH